MIATHTAFHTYEIYDNNSNDYIKANSKVKMWEENGNAENCG